MTTLRHIGMFFFFISEVVETILMLILFKGCVLPSGHESSLPPLRDGGSPGVKLSGLELQGAEAPQRQLKAQKRRGPPPSKVGNLNS